MCERCSKTFHTKFKLSRHSQNCKGVKTPPSLVGTSLLQSSSNTAAASTGLTVSCSAVVANTSASLSHVSATVPDTTSSRTGNYFGAAVTGDAPHTTHVSLVTVTASSLPSRIHPVQTSCGVTVVTVGSSGEDEYHTSGRGEGEVTMMSPPKGAGVMVATMPVLVHSAS